MKQPIFETPEDVLRFLSAYYQREESPLERRLRLSLRYCPGPMARSTAAISIGQAFADHSHLALDYPLSNKAGGRKRRSRSKPDFAPWYAQ